MTDSITLDRKTLNELLSYDSETGNLFWKERAPKWFKPTPARSSEHQANWWNARFAGKQAITAINSGGYKTGAIFSHPVRAHRIIWMMVFGTEPEFLDHIDGNPANNRIHNLRAVTASENVQNRCLNLAGTETGVMGVTMSKCGRFTARIGHNGEAIHLGNFATLEEAASARRAASTKFGFHPNHGRVT